MARRFIAALRHPALQRDVRLRWSAGLLWLLTAASGCDGCGSKSQDEPPSAATAPSSAADGKGGRATGVLTGVVRLTEGADLPEYSDEQLERKVLSHTERAALPESCSPPKITDGQPVRLTADGLLAGVMLAASDFATQPDVPPATRSVVIDDCRLTPALIVAKKGDTLRVTSKVNYPFMPAFGEAAVVKTLIPGQNYDVPLDQPGVSAVTCGFTAPCGRTDVIVLEHPYFTVTDGQGHFRFESFPADQAVKLNAWHPLFKEAEITVELGRGEERKVELVLEPAAPPPPAAAPAAAPAEPPKPPKPTKPAAPAPSAPKKPAAEPARTPSPTPSPAPAPIKGG
jgi:hypothetical protein